MPRSDLAMIKRLPFVPQGLLLAAMKAIRARGYSAEAPPPSGTLVPFIVAYADAACRGLGLHPEMQVCPGTKIPTLCQLVHTLAPIGCLEGVTGVVMAPDEFLRGEHNPKEGKFSPAVLRSQWLKFLQFLEPTVGIENLFEIVRPEWYPYVGKLAAPPTGLPVAFAVDYVLQTSAVEDFGNLIVLHNLAAGVLPTLPKALSPELVVALSLAGHSNTVLLMGSRHQEELLHYRRAGTIVVEVNDAIEDVAAAIMQVWNPDVGFEQPAYRGARSATAVYSFESTVSGNLQRVFREGPWASLPPPQQLTDEQLFTECKVPGTIFVVSRVPSKDAAVLTNGVSREPEYPVIPTSVLPLGRL